MSRLGPREMAEVLTVQSGEMLRIWRLARHTMQPNLLPGLCDGLLESFFTALGPLLASGARPADVAGRLAGILRVPPGGGGEQMTEEWKVAEQVLRAACESLGASPAVEAWLVAAAMAGLDAALAVARAAPGATPLPAVVRVHLLTDLEPARRTAS